MAVNKNRLVVLIGPTAVGKTACSVELAAACRGEIISGDSMQFYRYMDIGTAKISKAEMRSKSGQEIPHHLIDILNPNEPYSVADFQKDATKLVNEINARGKLPLLVGGTGLYVSALVDGYTFAETIPEDAAFRAEKKQQFAAQGGEALWQQLHQVDPISAAKISPNDAKRMIRALEVYQQTGIPISQYAKKNPPDWDIILLGLTMERELLYQRINQRVENMVAQGLVAEVQHLLALGYSPELKPMQGLGYRQICDYLAGKITLAEAIALIQKQTRHFAKRQLTWWRKEERIHWFPVTENSTPETLAAEMLAIIE